LRRNLYGSESRTDPPVCSVASPAEITDRAAPNRQQPLRFKDARGIGSIEDHVEVRLTRVVGKFVHRVDEVRRDLVTVLEDQQFCRFLEQAYELVAVLA
jgi:hypothetical protein